MSWQLAQCAWTDTQKLDRYLAENWEPFAVTEVEGTTIWLRRQVERHMAAAVQPRPRLESEVVRLIDEPTRERLERQLAELQRRLRGGEP
jgi:hypothetical protein